MFEYVFMQRGLMVGVLLGAVIPLIGVTVVLRRLSMIGDALSHTSLAGVAGGLIAGISPVVGAVVACLAGALCVEGVRRRFKEQSELAVAIVMAAGIGLAGVLSGFVPNSSSFNSFMFGSILTVSAQETRIIMAISVLAVCYVVCMRRELFLMSFDERHARAVGVHVGLTNFGFIIAGSCGSCANRRFSYCFQHDGGSRSVCAAAFALVETVLLHFFRHRSAYVFKRAHNFL